MNEEQLQYLESVVSQLEQEWFTIRLSEVRYLIAEVRSLRAKLDAVPVRAITKLRANLSTEGDYSIKRSDGVGMFIGETIMLGTLFETIDKWLDTQAVQP